MGYHIRTGLVEDHASTLDMILASISRGESLRYDCHVPNMMNRRKYQFNRILKAASVLTTECQGRFIGLRRSVKVREDWKNMAIIIEPSNTPEALTSIMPAQANQFDAIDRLKQFDGSMDIIHFTPTSDWGIEEFRLALQEIGFDLVPNPDEPGWIEDHKGSLLGFAVARTEKAPVSGFDLLSEYVD